MKRRCDNCRKPRVVRIAVATAADGAAPECFYSMALPSEDCPNPGFFGEEMLFLITALFGKGTKLKVVRKQFWQSSLSNKSDPTPYDDLLEGFEDVGLRFNYSLDAPKSVIMT